MRKRRKYSKQPMLYIDQPKFGKATANMQSNYRTPKKKKKDPALDQEQKVVKVTKKPGDVETERKGETVDKEPVKKRPIQQDVKEKEQKPKELETKTGTNTEKQHTKRKRFQEMTVEEKVNYFASLPVHVPKMKCEVKTANDRFRGVIYELDDGVVSMVTTRRKQIKINLAEISDIRLISF